MDGLRLSEMLRAEDPDSSTVMFLLTSAQHVSRQVARDAGIESVLIKPVRNTYLLRRIVDTLVTNPPSRSSRPDSSSPPSASPSPSLPSLSPSSSPSLRSEPLPPVAARSLLPQPLRLVEVTPSQGSR
jgi:hypothetical protein